jgi:hypothetical protein
MRIRETFLVQQLRKSVRPVLAAHENITQLRKYPFCIAWPAKQRERLLRNRWQQHRMVSFFTLFLSAAKAAGVRSWAAWGGWAGLPAQERTPAAAHMKE